MRTHTAVLLKQHSGDPPVFLRLSVKDLPSGHTLVAEASDTGDDCHYLIQNLPKNYDRTLVKSKRILGDFEICDQGGGTRALTMEDIEKQNPRLRRRDNLSAG